MRPLDLAAPIPRGRVVIEASAGTGKTFAVAGIVARLVIEESLPIDQVLVTTFTRAAASELRSRIRDRFVRAVALLSGQPFKNADEAADPIAISLLKTDGATDRVTRLRNAQAALTDFDAASIGTIHSLCQRILRLAGFDLTLDAEPDSNTRLVAEVVNDLLVTVGLKGTVPYAPEKLEELVRLALDNPRAELWVQDASNPAHVEALQTVRQCVREVRQRTGSTLTYDGLLYHAHRLVTDPAAERLRASFAERFTVAVVDEAQDTDQLQWELLDALFPPADATRSLFVVGDPKQSIYAFRGADVEGYVASRDASAAVFTLDRNFRSDQPLLDALNGLMQDATFGHGISYLQVSAPPHHADSALEPSAPVVEVVVLPSGLSAPATSAARADVVVQRVRTAIANGRAPEDIAILVGSHREGAPIVKGLRRHGIAVVSAGTQSVAKSTAARALQGLFLALERPAAPKPARQVALGWFGDLSAADLAATDSDRLLSTQEQLITWAATLRSVGIAALIEDLLSRESVIDRVAADGSLARHITDLGHLSELLHDRCGRRGTTAARALAVLAELEQMKDRSELVTRRIETDAAAVHLMTIHAAKGLEFPLVFVARQWRAEPWSKATDIPMGRFDAASAVRMIDCGWLLAQRADAAVATMLAGFKDEEARLLYVAMTRAKHQLVLVIDPDEDGELPTTKAFGVSVPATSGAALREALAPRLGAAAVRVRFIEAADVIGEAVPTRPAVEALDTSDLVPATPPSPIRAPFRRWSFTTISSKRTRVAVEERAGEDEFGAHDAAPGTSGTVGALAGLPAGAEFGTIIHSVLEHTDFSATDLDAEIRTHLARFANTPSLRTRHDELAAGLTAVLRTPLGGTAPIDLCLADITKQHRLDELRFDFALVDEAGRVRGTNIGDLLVKHLDREDPLRRYAALLASGALNAPLVGMLNGSIDLVVRHPSRAGEFLIADYKSNRLADYGQRGLADSMFDHHYPLQGLIYSVALYRYLRWRLGEADPSPRIAGFAYLYIRGMIGTGTPLDADGRVNGVFHWQAPQGLIPALSDLFSGVTV
jgi:exodeoxyribonuclease V beta subunit